MAKRIFVKLNMFTFNQPIFLMDDDNEFKRITELPEDEVSDFIINFANINNIDEVELSGDKQFAQRIIFDLHNTLTTEYAEKKVRVSLNGELCFEQ